ncbi:hypothetical protein FHS78_000606 [Parvibaculum indicum]|uniref:hypothetical protein n=1 Tax=Parvibaculum indicum TaxID=562969 RepID=UPI00141E7AA0|nr:hypothetical protein [Parvibaculum indicum]NIJ40336.1 hypothetical protein [Parvibaculum indicum]
MDKVIVYENEKAEGGISIVVPAEKFRGRILVKEEVSRDVYYEVEVATGKKKKNGEPVMKKEKRKRAEIVSPAQYRDETDDELLCRIAAKDVPDVPYRIMSAKAAYAERKQRAEGSAG